MQNTKQAQTDEKNNRIIFISCNAFWHYLVRFNFSIMSSPDKYITLRSVDALYAPDNEVVFEGITHANEFYSVSIPTNEIIDSLDYILQRRIEYITDERRRLINEQNRLKAKQKLWKSLNT